MLFAKIAFEEMSQAQCRHKERDGEGGHSVILLHVRGICMNWMAMDGWDTDPGRGAFQTCSGKS